MKFNQITKNFNIRFVCITVLIIIMLFLGIVICTLTTNNVKSDFQIEDDKVDLQVNFTFMQNVSKQIISIVDDFKLLHPIIEIVETNDYMYTTDYVNYRTGPDLTYDLLGTLSLGAEVYRMGICDNGWSKVFINNLECYIHSDFLSAEKPIVQVEQISTTKYSPEYLLNMGVVYDGGWKYTWYSEKVLPGGGLNIPGRWSDGNFVRDENNYICIASSDLSKGTVIETPWGTAKVYDCGCASGVIDIYVSW